VTPLTARLAAGILTTPRQAAKGLAALPPYLNCAVSWLAARFGIDRS